MTRVADLISIARIEDLTRREFISGAFAAALLIACGDDDETPDSAMRQLDDLFGPVALPSRPQRIIAGEDVTLNNMLAMGVKPIGGFIFADSLIRHTSHLLPEDYVDLRKEGQLDIEKALALDPDILISLGGTRSNPFLGENCEKWKALLPTFCYEYDFIFEEQIKNNVVELGEGLNMPDEAQELIQRFDERVADMKRKVTDAGFNDKFVTVVRVFDANNYGLRIGTLESVVFRAIGIPQPPGQDDPTQGQISISAENLGILNQSYALVVYADDDDFHGGRSSVTEDLLRDHAVWQSLTPVREGRAVFLPPWNGADIPKAMTILDEIEQFVLPLARS